MLPQSLNDLIYVLVLTSFVIACRENAIGNDAILRAQALEHFESISAVSEISRSTPLTMLGQELFWDNRVSANGQISCASCHVASEGGADRRRFSVDAREKLTARNSQTVFNSTLQRALRWTGDRSSAAHQAEKSLTGSMGFANADDVVGILTELGYQKKFEVAFPDISPAVTPGNYAKAIESYEQTLITPSEWDQFLNGNDQAIDVSAKAGLKQFLEKGCMECHEGKLLGGESFQRFGVAKDYWEATKSAKQDVGRFDLTKKEEDRFVFRVSMLRNIESTGPYFHDGSVESLHEAIQVMAEVQTGTKLSYDDASAIESFLKTLSGTVPPNYRKPLEKR